MEVDLSNKIKITQNHFDSDTFEQEFSWLNKLTVWASLIVIPWAVLYMAWHVFRAVQAGRL
jgi:hypothetical protein